MLAAILLSLVMTWTVESKSSVTASGDVPAKVEAEYASSYQKSQVRSGDTATLTLTHLSDIVIEQVSLSLKSNKTSGAGEIQVLTGEQLMAQKSGSLKEWIGVFDKDNYHPVEVLTEPFIADDDLTIVLIGQANSLYVESFTITYQAASPYSLTLMVGKEVYSTLYETEGGAGVILPTIPNQGEWRFVGWSETPFYAQTTVPTFIPANSRVYLDGDAALWAVFKAGGTPEENYLTDLQSGEYRYVNRVTEMALAGLPNDKGQMTPQLINLDDDNQLYYFHFLAPDTVTIQHVASGAFIGHSGTKLVEKETKWLVHHDEEEILIYTIVKDKTYVLWLNIWVSSSTPSYTGLLQATPVNSPMALRLPKQESDDPTFTCHPEYGLSTPLVPADSHEHVVRFGIYEIHIRDGHKQLILKQ